ncbi:xanthine dehydrogenase family protein molybdopterin-binding subunit [Chloroflexota bacterium]
MTTYYGLDEGEAYRPWLWPVPEGATAIAQRGMRRKDGSEKASGRALYPRDVVRPGMLYAKFLLSPYAHARIVSMDTSAAEAYPGVRYVMKWDDPELYWYNPLGNFGRASEPVTDTAHYAEQPVGCIVVADSEAIVDEALKLVDIVWEELPFILDWDECLEPGTSILRPDKNEESNLESETISQVGDVEVGFAESDNIIEFTMRNEEDVWAGVEPHSGTAEWRGEYLEVWPRTQVPSLVHNYAPQYGSTWDKCNVHAMYIGAQFGGIEWNSYARNFHHLPILLAKRTQKPVQMLFDGSHFIGSGETCGTYFYKVGFNDDGTILAVSCTSHWAGITISKIRDGTKIPNLLTKKICPWISRGGTTCYRHGGPSNMVFTPPYTHVAAELGMDETEVALINDGCKQHDMAWVNENVKVDMGMDPTRDSLQEGLAAGKAAIGWDNKKHAPGTAILPNGNYHGLGFTFCHTWDPSLGNYAAGMWLGYDGGIVVSMRHADGGWCGETAYCQIVADEFGCEYEKVTHRPFDHAGWEGCPGMSSVGFVSNTSCMVRGARKLKALFLTYAVNARVGGVSIFSGLSPDDLDIKDGMIFEKANPENECPIRTASTTYYRYCSVWDKPPSRGITVYKMGRGCIFHEVEVDPDTGMVEVKKIAVAYDYGKVVNPEAVEGQAYGGTYMAVGRNYMEEVFFDPITGVKLNNNLIWYPIALMNDCGPIDVSLIETGLGYGPYGSCGGSEFYGACGCTIWQSSIYNAIGKWVDAPATPDRILKALGKA